MQRLEVEQTLMVCLPRGWTAARYRFVNARVECLEVETGFGTPNAWIRYDMDLMTFVSHAWRVRADASLLPTTTCVEGLWVEFGSHKYPTWHPGTELFDYWSVGVRESGQGSGHFGPCMTVYPIDLDWSDSHKLHPCTEVAS